MPTVDRNAPGTFCWVELGTTDQSAAKEFYGALFGWTHVDHPMGPGEFYTMFQLGGRTAAAAYTMTAREKNVPPHWNIYVSVANADARAEEALALGGQTPGGAFDVGANGRMAIVIDPTGAAICLWQANRTQGLEVMGEPGSYCWADLSTDDRPKAKQFYEGLFGWTLVPGKDKDESSYLHIMAGEQGIGGILPDAHRNPSAPPHWMPYFMTADADASVAKAKQLGATIYAEPMSVDKSLRIAILADPQGAVFALFQN